MQTDTNGDPRFYVLDDYSHDGFAYFYAASDEFISRVKHDSLAAVCDSNEGIIAWAPVEHANKIVRALNA